MLIYKEAKFNVWWKFVSYFRYNVRMYKKTKISSTYLTYVEFFEGEINKIGCEYGNILLYSISGGTYVI